MADPNSANYAILVSRERIGNAVGDALRLFVGRGRRYSVKQLSNATGVKDRVIECAMIQPGTVDYRPLSLEALASIAQFLGAIFTTEWLSVAGQGAFDLPDADDPPPGAVAADTCEDSAVVARAASDGRFDGDEVKHLRTVGVRMMSRGAHLASLGRAAA